MEDNPTGSIIIRRGPTDDRLSFVPLGGEIIYDSTTEQFFVGDSQTLGGKPAFGDKIQVDDQGNITALFLRDEGERPEPEAGLIRYNTQNNTLEYADGQNFNLIAASPFDDPASILYVAPGGRDDNTFGDKRGRTPGTAFASVNAACREAERIIKNAAKGLGPYVKTITFNQNSDESIIESISDVSPYKKIFISNGDTSLDAEEELRAGFRIIGQTSGAKAIIEEYKSTEESTDELIIEVEEGEFVVGETLKFGSAIPSAPFIDGEVAIPEITIFIATGIYYEHLPIKVPVNVSLKGDEFRRCIIRPRPGMSNSPYSDISFMRDNDKIGVSGSGRTFGRHYLTNRSTRIYDFAENQGGYKNEAVAIQQNRSTIIASSIEYIETNHSKLTYDEAKTKQNLGYIIDAIVLDLEFGGNREVLHIALYYYEQNLSLQSNQITALADSIDHISNVINGFVETPAVQNIVSDFATGIAEVVRDNFNYPKNNEEQDVFLMNDATIIRNITVQRHGGFMEVLDPEGQIKTRSPYTQSASSFSRSQAPEISFAGGMFVDGFCGNLRGNIASIISDQEIVLENFEREPQWPTSFFINGSRFQIDKIDSVGVSDNQYRAVLSDDTPWQDSYYQIDNAGGSLPSLPFSIEILTAGNVSMLSNDFTQINDVGYGLYCTNAARAEAVSVFSYYCHIAYLSEKGSEIRSLNGSSAYGDFALVAEGSDPFEIPDVVNLTKNQIQTAEIITNSNFANNEGDIQVFVREFDYIPFVNSEIEIDHTGTVNSDGEEIELVRYLVTGVSETDTAGIVQLGLSAGESNTSAGLATDLPDGAPVTIRNNQVFQFENIKDTSPAQSSNALVFQDDLDTVYRILNYEIQDLPPSTADLSFAQSYDYVKLNVADSAGTESGSGQNNDSTIRLETDLDQKETTRIVAGIQSGQFYEFGFNGVIHEIIDYRSRSETGESYAEIDIQPSLSKSLNSYTQKPTFRAGKKAGSTAEISFRISTLRTTNHDLLDIGTGSFQDANYPKRIFGDPVKPIRQENEVVERNKGRVFFSTVDQDGNFRVGEFFKVDQGTGSVTFAASIALSNLDGLGFKRGVAISEFSVDDGMLDNASDSVPVESAVRQYVNRRLGLGHNDDAVSNLIGPGFLDRGGNLPMSGTLDLNSNRIENLQDPASSQDASTKLYVDNRTFSVNNISTTVDNDISIDTSDIPENSNLYFTETRVKNSLSAVDNGGDGSFSYDSASGTFSYTGPSAAEVRAHFSAAGDLSYNPNIGEFSVNLYDSENFDTDFSNQSTDDLSEGSANRYFSNSLVDSHLSGGSGITYSSGTISHSNTSNQSSVNNSGNTVIQDISVDEFGHVTSLGSTSLSPSDVGALPANSKAVDSDLLDGLNSTQFLRSDANNDFVDFANKEQSSYDVDGRLYWDLSAGLYIKSSNSNSSSARLLWSGANVSAGNGIAISYGGEDYPTIKHSNTSSQSSVSNSGNNVVQSVTLDGFGHITGIVSTSIDISTRIRLNGSGTFTVPSGVTKIRVFIVGGGGGGNNGGSSSFSSSDGSGGGGGGLNVQDINTSPGATFSYSSGSGGSGGDTAIPGGGGSGGSSSFGGFSAGGGSGGSASAGSGGSGGGTGCDGNGGGDRSGGGFGGGSGGFGGGAYPQNGGNGNNGSDGGGGSGGGDSSDGGSGGDGFIIVEY